MGKKFNPEIALANFQITGLRVLIIRTIHIIKYRGSFPSYVATCASLHPPQRPPLGSQQLPSWPSVCLSDAAWPPTSQGHRTCWSGNYMHFKSELINIYNLTTVFYFTYSLSFFHEGRGLLQSIVFPNYSRPFVGGGGRG